ncbi:MAG: NADH-quinone oxidoreductase subunit H [Deltaproteobacteria bacterium]|nr:NADH-quinone oxidoreductase subunit H [Deltaproteobacteria bacterium]
MLVEFGIVVLKAVVVLVVLLHFALFTIWVERKGSALIQDRVGANRASWFGFDLAGVLNTIVADPVKALLKEDFLPKGTSQLMHSLGPFLAVFPVLLSFAVIPLGPPILWDGREISLQLAELNAGVLYVFAMGSLATYGVVLAGWVSNNKFSLFGGLRATAQMISYEISMGISIIGVLVIYQTLDLPSIVEYQRGTFLGLPRWGVFLNPIGFILFFFSMMAETKRAPFDLPESESELVAGYLTEYSGMKFLLFWLGEFAEIVVASALIVVLFFGGWQLPYFDVASISSGGIQWGVILGVAAFMLKVAFFCVLQVVVRWTLPRFRYDQLMGLCWKIMFPVALVNLLATVVLVLSGFYA